VINIDGIKVKGRAIQRKQFLPIWRQLSEDAFPKVKVFLLEEEDFTQVLAKRRCREDEIREFEEWVRLLTVGGTDACVFNPEDASVADYIIVIRKNPYHKITEILEHELTHIARGDL
jgi:hypothetical protein